ncbi:MAG TPA: Sua5/YciO/YrdC/YwlC family protein [Turneriella sp.]|nr:Sua5/YciO/YrdC/YwlC family protein [Turneriella sp.]
MRFIDIDTQKPQFDAIKAAAELLADDYPLVFPTDTTFGILMRFTVENAARLHALRRDDLSKPFLAVLSEDFNWKSLVNADFLSHENIHYVETYWPGTNTLLFPKAKHLAYPTGNRIALRMPAVENNRAFHTLVQLCDFALMAPLFNRPGEPVITTRNEAAAKFAEIEYAFWDDFYRPQNPSALWDLSQTPIVKVR